MFKNLLMTLAIVLATCTMTMAQAQGRLKGKITDENGETVPFANVIVEKGGGQVAGASSDFDGNYDINPIPPGTYTLKASCIGYNAFVVNNIVIPANKITFYNFKMMSGAIKIDEVVVVDYEIPLISADNTQSGATITSEEIAKLPVRSAEGVAASVGGVFSSDGEVGSIRGSREGAVYYIDGVKVIGNGSVPQSAIDQVDVILGGTPAMYGDAMGGIINMTTKGPSRAWGGGIEAEYSVDGYGHGRLGGSLQGPLIKSKKNDQEALLGFFLAFDINRNEYGSTSAIPYYRATDEWMNEISEHPLVLTGTDATSTYQRAAFTKKDFLNSTRYLNNTANQSINVTGKIDVRTGSTSNLTIGGSLYRGGGHYDGGRGQQFFNTDKNYLSKSGTYRGYIRFSQRFPSDAESNSLISNVYYSIQADYTHSTSESGDPDLWNNIFAYGNLGKFTTTRQPNFRFSQAAIDSVLVNGEYKTISNAWVLDNYYDTYVDYEPSNFNPLLVNYVNNYYELYEPFGATGYYDNISNIIQHQGLVNGLGPSAVYQLYAVPGTVQTGYAKSVSDQIAVNINGSLTLGRGDNSHEIKLGFQFEEQNRAAMQYDITSYNKNPWTLMRQMVNAHIAELDVDHPYAISYDGFVDTIMYNRMYDESTQFTIDARLRQAMGLPVDGTEWILIDTYDFDNNTMKYYDNSGKLCTAKVDGGLDMSMFGADELTRDAQFSVYYYGYTYDGNRKYGLFERPSLTEFFNHTDSEGILDRPIGAQQPIYMAGYIQDKFAFKDLIFNIGVRVDRFDANQDVLKDPYVLYDFYNVGDIKGYLSSGSIESDAGFVGTVSDIYIPDNIGDDYVPYVNKINEITSIVGYRKGNTWYNAEGVEVNDPTAIGMGAGAAPWLTKAQQEKQEVNINSFKDYDPAWTVMPRISFSFPISDEALFFAHYDVLTQRPSSAYYCSPLYYLRFNETSATLANPNLKPMQTIDYELGFTQKVTNTSSLTITAYYREIRNSIQMYRFNGAYPKSYNSYSNLDFGTVKGLTASYDMRRTKNARIRASYTLQYADMTGSSTSTASALIAAGVPNLRSTFPTNEDRRHGFNLTLDYRFSIGKDYNGPVIHRKDGRDIQFLSNTGFSLQINGGSGTPYTASRTVSSPISGGNNLLKGTYNGSRIPAAFRFDLRVDKDFNFTIGGKEEGKKGHDAYMNVYVQVLNLLNSKNITNVYAATGNADDDGYLSSPAWQREIQSQIDPQAYIQMYEILVNNCYWYSMPRHIRIGLSFNF